jgi:hypothetical protein
MDRLDRIREMEERMDRVGKWVRSLSRTLEEQLSVQEDFFELSSYYESDLWMEDYEADEAGELPPDLKRGVLSEDGLFNLLTEYEELIRRLKNQGGTR